MSTEEIEYIEFQLHPNPSLHDVFSSSKLCSCSCKLQVVVFSFFRAVFLNISSDLHQEQVRVEGELENN